MKNRTPSTGSPLLMTGTALLILSSALATTAFNPFDARKKARQAQEMNSVRQISLALNFFATDFDGQFPNDETGAQFIKDPAFKVSNDYYRQLFLAGVFQQEDTFWVQSATVCSKERPDNELKKDGKVDPKEILKPGDCGWAYLAKQTSTSNLARPLIVDAFKIGTTEYDLKMRKGKVMVGRIDGAVVMVTPGDKGALIDAKGLDLFSAKEIWAEEKPDLRQPAVSPEKLKAAKKGDKK